MIFHSHESEAMNLKHIKSSCIIESLHKKLLLAKSGLEQGFQSEPDSRTPGSGGVFHTILHEPPSIAHCKNSQNSNGITGMICFNLIDIIISSQYFPHHKSFCSEKRQRKEVDLRHFAQGWRLFAEAHGVQSGDQVSFELVSPKRLVVRVMSTEEANLVSPGLSNATSAFQDDPHSVDSPVSSPCSK